MEKTLIFEWKGRLKKQYKDFAEFEHYDEIYGLAKRLGFKSAKEAWQKNPLIQGSTDPNDYKVVKESLINESIVEKYTKEVVLTEEQQKERDRMIRLSGYDALKYLNTKQKNTNFDISLKNKI